MINLRVIAVAGFALGLTAGAAQAQSKNDPAATLQHYLDAVNSADYDALLDVLSDDIPSYSYRSCTPQMKPKECLATFIKETILQRHGSLVSPKATVKGDQIIAVIEVRHDGTRAAHAPRMLGVDTITVKNNKIYSFKFEQDANDPGNKKIAAYNAASAPPPAAKPN